MSNRGTFFKVASKRELARAAKRRLANDREARIRVVKYFAEYVAEHAAFRFFTQQVIELLALAEFGAAVLDACEGKDLKKRAGKKRETIILAGKKFTLPAHPASTTGVDDKEMNERVKFATYLAQKNGGELYYNIELDRWFPQGRRAGFYVRNETITAMIARGICQGVSVGDDEPMLSFIRLNLEYRKPESLADYYGEPTLMEKFLINEQAAVNEVIACMRENNNRLYFDRATYRWKTRDGAMSFPPRLIAEARSAGYIEHTKKDFDVVRLKDEYQLIGRLVPRYPG